MNMIMHADAELAGQGHYGHLYTGIWISDICAEFNQYPTQGVQLRPLQSDLRGSDMKLRPILLTVPRK
jgi:hypothetical protein